MTQPRILMLPGLHNSGAGHWQTCWEAELPNCRRVVQQEWDEPCLADWRETLIQTIAAENEPVILVGHSLACALVAHIAFSQIGHIPAAAFLVAPADVEMLSRQSGFLKDFAPLPLTRLPFPTMVVSSSNDPYMDSCRAREFAQAWHASFIDVGPCGHINTESGHGHWQEGRELLDLFVAKTVSTIADGAHRYGTMADNP